MQLQPDYNQRIESLTRKRTHSEMLSRHLLSRRPFLAPRCILVETGCGISTLAFAEAAMSLAAIAYSCDINPDKIAALRAAAGTRVSNVEFVVGDSKEALPRIAEKHGRIDFMFLDAAASAMHTFQEFLAVEPYLNAGASILVDNAALPRARQLLSPCRKGRVLVPYLLASPWWELRGHPSAGDSMVSAIRHDRPEFAHGDYEWPGFVDTWEQEFAQYFGKK